jgi:hypothetical protein
MNPNITLVSGVYSSLFLSRGKTYLFASYDRLDKEVIAYSNDYFTICKKYPEQRYEILLSANFTNN